MAKLPGDDPSGVVVPFGKHKGATVAELLAKDPAYVEWLTAQGWLAQRFAELHTALITRGAGSDDTPEHNVMQARFLDETYRCAFLLAAGWQKELTARREWERAHWERELKRDVKEAERTLQTEGYSAERYMSSTSWREKLIAEAQSKLAAAQAKLANPPAFALSTTVAFEQRGIDVVIDWGIRSASWASNPSCRIELKPSVGDDYPSVMRQMARLGAGSLLVEHYTGAGVPLEQVRAMFEANGMRLLLSREIDAELAAARALLADWERPYA